MTSGCSSEFSTIVKLFFLLCFSTSTFVTPDCGCGSLNRINNDVQKEDTCSSKSNSADHTNDMSLIPGGFYIIGTDKPVFQSDGESPQRRVKINDFFMDKYEVSNKNFKEFVDATAYKTDAEKFNDSFVFQSLLSDEEKKAYADFRVVSALWWYKVNGTNWLHPHGPGTNLDGNFTNEEIGI